MPGPTIAWESVRKVYPGDVVALEGLTLEAERGEVLALVGRSGGGKTTALKAVNRLVEPTSGRVTIDGKDVRAKPAVDLRRGIGWVVARAGLLPHLSVSANVELLPRALGWGRARRRRRAADLLALAGLDPGRFGDRLPAELSSGEQQRVGLARALVLDPPIVLMDEPTGALDPVSRDAFQRELARLQRELAKTVVLVTHDLAEAERLASRIAVLDAGRLVQVGAPRELRTRPANAFVQALVQRREAA
jgi:osmoprotectant transport system ATP-binding protein